MRITDLKVFPIWVGLRNQLVVMVATDSGLYGLGEAGVSGTLEARERADGSTLLVITLQGAGAANPWGIFDLDGCAAEVAVE